MNKLAAIWRIPILLLLFCLVACSPQSNLSTPAAATPKPSLTPWVFQTPTALPIPPSPPAALAASHTPQPISTTSPMGLRPSLPTQPAQQVTAYPVINGQTNLNRLTELHRWGKGTILYLDYTPDGRYLVLATQRGISLVHALTLREERFIEITGGVPMLAVSPDGRTLAVASWSSRIMLYDFQLGKLLRTFDNGDHGAPLALRFFAGGRMISLGTTGEINLMWEAETGKLVHRWYTTGNSAMAANPAGDLLATADFNGSIFLWSGVDGRSPGRFWRDAEVEAVRFSPDGQWIAAGYGDHRAGLWDLSEAKMRYSLPHDDRVTALAFSPDGALLATGGWDNRIKLWRAQDGKALRTFEGVQGRVNQVAFSPDGDHLATLTGDGILRVWRISDGRLSAQSLDYLGLRQAAFSQDAVLLAAGDDGSLQMWNVPLGARGEVNAAQPGGIAGMVVSSDGRWLASAGLDGYIRLWSLPGLTLMLEVDMPEAWVSSLALADDGSFMAASAPGVLRIWSLPGGTLQTQIDTGSDTALGMAFTPDHRLLAAGTMDGSLRIWRTSDGSLQQTLRAEGKFISALVFGAAGQTFAVGGDEASLTVWRLYNTTLAQTISGKKEDRLSALAYAPDGQVLVAAWWDNSVRFYNPANGAVLHSLQFSAAVRSLSFSADGRLLAFSLADGTIRLWTIQ